MVHEVQALQDSSIDEMRQLVSEIARVLVDQPEEVVVEALADADATMLRLRVAPTDIGKVIGKQGRTARSMRDPAPAAHGLRAARPIRARARGGSGRREPR